MASGRNGYSPHPSPRASRPCPAATAMAAAVVYSFPLLPAAEISTCLSELGITFTEASLNKPEPEPVAKLFEELVVSQMGVTRCGAARPARDAVAAPRLTGKCCPVPETSCSSRCLPRWTR